MRRVLTDLAVAALVGEPAPVTSAALELQPPLVPPPPGCQHTDDRNQCVTGIPSVGKG